MRVGHEGGMLIQTFLGIFAIRALVEQRFREGNLVVDDSFMSEFQALCVDQLPLSLQQAGEIREGYFRARREASRLISEAVESYFKPGAALDLDFLDSFYPYVLKLLVEKGLLPQTPSPATGGDP